MFYQVFPNPASDNVYIVSPCIEQVKGELINLQGQVVKSFSLQPNSNKIDVQEVPSGFYVLRIHDEENYQNIKLIISR